MAERKQVNMYYPPDFDPKKHGNINAYHGVHALRERANKIDQGILIIRFEMPFNIWCGSNAEDLDPEVKGCRKHIGIGVRYNAEKTRVGHYYTTPIYQFKMRCHLCSNAIVIRTDPGNMDYLVVQGARRVQQSWDVSDNGQVVPNDVRVGRKLADDAMYKLEHEGKEQDTKKDSAPRIAQMVQIADRVKDDYLANRVLRDKFREAKKERLEASALAERLRTKAGVDLDIVAERETDIKMARLLSLQAHCDAEDVQNSARDVIEDRDIFARVAKAANTKKELALITLQKAAGSRHKELVKKKGFGLLVKKIQKRDPDLLKQCRLVSPASLSSPSTSSSISSPKTPVCDPDPPGLPEQTAPSGPSLSLSLLGDYGSSGSETD